MLKAFRKHTKIIIWAVVVSFVLWGGFSVGTSFTKTGRYAGTVFGKNITFQEYNRFYRASQIFSLTGEAPKNPDIIKLETWKNIIYSREAKRKRINISDDAVRNELRRIFKAQGVEDLTPEYYKQWLKRTLRIPPNEFENQIRELLRIQKMFQMIDQQPIDLPSRDDALNRFLEDSVQARFEIARFLSMKDAVSFKSKLNESADWDHLVEEIPNGRLESTELLNLVDLAESQKIPDAVAAQIFQMEIGSVSEPIEVEEESVLFYFEEKVEADEAKFDKPTEKIYLEILKNEKKQARLIRWNIELLQNANLVDLLPSSEGV